MEILFHCQVTFKNRVRMCAYERERRERESETTRAGGGENETDRHEMFKTEKSKRQTK